MAEKETKDKVVLERTYNVPLRKEFLKAPNWKRTNKAMIALKQFLQHHLKSETVKVDSAVSDFLWKHGLKNPPHHVKVKVTKTESGVIWTELFGEAKKAGAKRKEEKASKKKDPKAKAAPVDKPEA